MTWIKCKKCGRKVNEKMNKCPKCGKSINKEKEKIDYKKLIAYILFVIVQIALIVLLFVCANEILYADVINDLLVIVGLILLLVINNVLVGKKLYEKKSKKIGYYILYFVVIVSFIMGAVFAYRTIKALIYDNSYEVYHLAEKYELKEAKQIKKVIDDIFEYDFDDVSSRNIVIGNFYEDEDNNNYILYIDDIYGNYRLKFYLDIKNEKIENIYWKFNDTKLYLYEDGKKTENFEYYYAMYIVDSLIGEGISGLATIEEDIEKIVRVEFEESANAMLTFDELIYNSENNIFTYKCSVENMDYYADIENKEFDIEFKRLSEAKDKKVWYYGDSSFDYVNWSVKF